MADAPDSKSGRGNPVRVQVPPPAPTKSISSTLRLTIHPRVLFKLSVYCPRHLAPTTFCNGTTVGVLGCDSM